ncbi:MAG TPA: bifunctional diguanylate cyclase/phosphodiesterase [Angustibacter sp.]|nr:bifunctional diguanylate cyclase/phosphodiesterase [Angustibacter sp.]
MGGIALVVTTICVVVSVASAAALAVLLVVRDRERERVARRDPLTQLGNRTLLAEAAEQVLGDLDDLDGNGSHGPALLLVDLDGFKDVNDTLGHVAGDEVLVEVAHQLVAAAGSDSLVTRLGGDEFAILIRGPINMSGASVRAKRILGALTLNEFRTRGVSIDIRASIGVTVAPQDGRTLSDLMQHADVAMYQAKRSRSGVATYDPAYDDHSTDRLETLAHLREAMLDDQLHVRYQPVIRADGHQLAGFEALLRWEHPERGLLLPAEFIPIAERTSLIHALTRWVLLTAVRDASRWRSQGLEASIAVNISPVSLEFGLLGIVEEVLALHRWPAELLVLEITESAVTDNPDTARAVVEALRDRGIQVSVDDFGAGYTSLSQLRGLPVHQLKIDRQFITALERSPNDDAVVTSIIELGHRLGLTIVAEGVETEATASRLSEMDCDDLQGFWFARPMVAAEVLEWASEHAAGRLRRPAVADDPSDTDGAPDEATLRA